MKCMSILRFDIGAKLFAAWAILFIILIVILSNYYEDYFYDFRDRMFWEKFKYGWYWTKLY